MPTEHVIAYRKSDRPTPERSFEVLLESGWYTAPVTGTYSVICIGGGGGGAGFFVSDGIEFNGQNGSRGSLVQMEIFLNRGQTIPYMIGSGGKGGKGHENEFIGSPAYSGTNGGITVFDNQVSADGGNGGVASSMDLVYPYFYYIDKYHVNDDNAGMRLWYGDGGPGGSPALEARDGHDGCIIVVYPEEPIEN